MARRRVKVSVEALRELSNRPDIRVLSYQRTNNDYLVNYEELKPGESKQKLFEHPASKLSRFSRGTSGIGVAYGVAVGTLLFVGIAAIALTKQKPPPPPPSGQVTLIPEVQQLPYTGGTANFTGTSVFPNTSLTIWINGQSQMTTVTTHSDGSFSFSWTFPANNLNVPYTYSVFVTAPGNIQSNTVEVTLAAAPQPPPPPTANAYVTITVVSGTTGKPIQGAAVSAATDASGGGIYDTVYTDSTGYAKLPVNSGCLPSPAPPGVGVFVYITATGYSPRSFAIPCLSPNQLYPLGTVPL